MDCFRPNPNDLTVRAVCKGYQSAKSLEVKCEGPFIRLCSRKGEVLESVRLDSVRWTPCALPGGQDHCLSLQYKEPQVTEIFLKAKSRKAVAQLAARLDKAARHLPPKQPSPSAQTVHVTAHPPSEPEDPPAAPHAPSQCTNCRNLARLIDEHEAQTIELDSVYSELTELKAELQALRDKNSQLSSQFDAAEGKAAALMLAEQAAKRRAEELEKCLAEAAERCEKLLQELQAVAQAADKSTAACRGLQSRLAEANEEKALLVAALTSAQAQLHDAQVAFQETAAQLNGASQSCSTAKAQATTTRAELGVARKESMQYAEAAQLAQQEVDVLRAKLHRIEEEYNAKEMLWTQERARLEGALSSAHLASRSTDASSSAQELSRLTDEVAELKSQLTDTRDAGALWQYESRAEAAEERAQHATDRAEAAEAAAAEARREAAKVAKELETHRAALYREAEALREKAASAEKEAAAAIAELASHKTAAARAASEARTAEQQLAVALAAQAEAVRERNALQARLDQMGVELERARRETEAAENRAMAVHGRAAGGEGGRA